MLANNNHQVINKLAKNTVRTNKRQFSICSRILYEQRHVHTLVFSFLRLRTTAFPYSYICERLSG